MLSTPQIYYFAKYFHIYILICINGMMSQRQLCDVDMNAQNQTRRIHLWNGGYLDAWATQGTCRASHVGMSTFPVGRVWKIKWYSQRQKKVTTSWSFFEQEHVCTMHVFHFTTWVRNDIHTLTRLSLPFSLSLRKQAIKSKETTHTYLCTVSTSSLST